MRQKFLLQFKDKKLEVGGRTCIMGVVNVTPDSFYDGGKHFPPESAIAYAERLFEEGADIVDIGGQSTRPQSEPIGADEELRRVLPVLKGLRSKTSGWISIDTYRSQVAKICIEHGADLINDVSSFRMDESMPGLIAAAGVPVVCMHFLESIHPMPSFPTYTNLLDDIRNFFRETLRIADAAGVRREQIILDPGIGFGKTLEHNINIIQNLSFLRELRRPVLVGPSRKSFIGKITGLPAEERIEGTAAAVAVCILQGAHIIRVHDVLFFKKFCEVLDALLPIENNE